MSQLMLLESKSTFDELFALSEHQPVLLLKHSTKCPISANAYKEFTQYIQTPSEAYQAALVKVIENRDVSLYIADVTTIEHQSPQLLLIKNKAVVWKSSHWEITESSIADALARL